MDKPINANTITATALNRRGGTILRQVIQTRRPVIVERDGFPVVVIVPFEDYPLRTLTRNQLKSVE